MVPRLWKTHPNFFIIFFITAVMLHLGMGLAQFLTPERFDGPTFHRLYEVASIEIWGVGHLIVWVLMTFGAYYHFSLYARAGLGLGLFICLARGLLMEFSLSSGGGLFAWGTLAALHYAQLAEPPVNPLTEKR